MPLEREPLMLEEVAVVVRAVEVPDPDTLSDEPPRLTLEDAAPRVEEPTALDLTDEDERV